MTNAHKVKKILVVTMSNLGDVILSTPVIDVLKRRWPQVRLDVMLGPNVCEVFDEDPAIHRVIIYHKKASIGEKVRLIRELQRERYDFVVDLKNSFIGPLMRPIHRTSIWRGRTRGRHMQDIHLEKLSKIGLDVRSARRFIPVSDADKTQADKLLRELDSDKKTVFINPTAKSHLKRWASTSYAELIDRIGTAYDLNIVLVGSLEEKPLVEELTDRLRTSVLNLCGQTSIRELAILLGSANILITNDTATLHMAGIYPELATLAIFGPTDPVKYGPVNPRDIVVQAKIPCVPCEKAQCRLRTHECLKDLSVDRVYNAFEDLINEK